uniref:Arginyl-tRNA--protein transferase 1 n=1 Tax=Caenorhabditis tropicalis TaxID=1561998 RepID=A0A1I7U477_9PELO
MLSAGAWAHSLRCTDYAALLDQGWRRSGRYLYKPHNPVTCCPQFTIRLDVTRFKMSRSQKRAMRQMNEFLKTGKRPVCGIKKEGGVREDKKEKPEIQVSQKKEKDPDRPVLTKKEIRTRRFEEKCRKQNVDPEVIRAARKEKEDSRQRTIRSFIDEESPEWAHRLEVKLVALKTPEFDARDEESFELYKKYQMTIHKDENCRLAGYRRFLCDSPLFNQTIEGIEMGSFHMWFLLDGKLIAVSVVDVLPNCLSAKYMFYDPDYSFLSMGTYTALREIEETRRLERHCAALKYYYMGYYIHSCPKMRYKAKFRPSDLLCDQSFQWIEFDECNRLLDASENPNGFVEFAPGAARPASPPIAGMIVYCCGAYIPFSLALLRFPSVAQNEEFMRKVREIAHLVGPNLSEAVYYFNEFNPA